MPNRTPVPSPCANKLTLALAWCLASMVCYATHNRAGEITYSHIAGYTYSITLVTYTYTPSAANEDRDKLTLSWGDNTLSELPRISIVRLPDDYQKNTYTGTHSFPGPGTYTIVMEDKNRNEGIDNITESVYVPFTVQTQLTINALIGDNSTPLLLNPPIDKAVVGQKFIHNPTAYDLDGDSLSYYLTICAGSGGLPIEGYRYPAASNSLYVDAATGDLVWDAPMAKGKYNVAIVISEYRRGVQISAIVRDIQIDVEESDNQPPQIEPLPVICAFAGDTVRFAVEAADPDGGLLSLVAAGGPLNVELSPAQFLPATGLGRVSSEFSWATQCQHIRTQPYTVLFKSSDAGPPSLTDQKTASITIMGKAQEIDTAILRIDELQLQFAPPACYNAERMQIYRSRAPIALSGAGCPPDMPSGYELIADTAAGLRSFVDDNKGTGLPQGFAYCYRTQSVYPGGTLSYPGSEYCAEVRAGAAVITNVSVASHYRDSAQIMVRWTRPILLDTSVFPGPFRADLYSYGCRSGEPPVLISIHTEPVDTSALLAVSFAEGTQLCYQVQWYSLGTGLPQAIGRPLRASTIDLSASASDRRVQLRMASSVPWENSSYVIYRSADSGATWDSIGVSALPVYTDTLVDNHVRYCYRTESIGSYALAQYPQGLSNWSNMICTTPVDTVAPRPPRLQLVQDCGTYRNVISRINGEHTDGAVLQHLYYKECEHGEFMLIATLDMEHTSFSHQLADSVRTMGGCYAMALQDASGNISLLSEQICTYSCPTYLLPTVFTPNGDGANDLWRPIQNRYVQKVELELFDIWGNSVFTTQDPQVRWDGTDMHGKKLSDGMFYYICDVYEQWLNCTSEPRTIIGFVHKFSDGRPQPPSQ